MTLKDLPEGWTSPDDPFIYMLRATFSDDVTRLPTRVYRGVYEAHINFHKEIQDLIVDDWPSFHLHESGEWDRWIEYTGHTAASFGVVDHWSQLPLAALDADPRNLLVYLGLHRRADQSPDGGWRWHRWGPYLGVHAPENSTNYEYLHEATDVVEVWSYCVVEVRGDDGPDHD